MTSEQLLRDELAEELHGNILPFWINRVLDSQGGFHGRIDGLNRLHPEAGRSAILCGRLLWTFSSAYRISKRGEYLSAASAIRDYLVGRFIDREYGGVYWSLNADGSPADTKKQFYAIAFAIYGLSEYARATGDASAVTEAVALYETIEKYAFDAAGNGYEEAAARDWSELEDVRLSDKDDNERRTMNTHLHILEAYTNLYRVWPDEGIRKQTNNLVEIFLDRIAGGDGHLGLFFDEKWRLKSEGCFSYGHDIEASWLLFEAAAVTGGKELCDRTRRVCERIADAALEGLLDDGSMIYEHHADGSLDTERHWWVQAECVVGLFYLSRYHNRPEALEMASKCWNYIKNNIIDRNDGEWHWSIMPDGSVNRHDDKAGFWKCPYHNGRMCMEIISLVE